MIQTTFVRATDATVQFDEFDRRIAQSLLEDGRRVGKDLSALVGLSEATISRRCGALDASHAFAVCGFVDPWQCGCDMVAIARFSVSGSVDDAARAVTPIAEVHRISWTANDNAIEVLIAVGGAVDLHRVLDAIHAASPQLRHHSTRVLLALHQGHDSGSKVPTAPSPLKLRDSVRQRHTDLRLIKLLQRDYRMTFTAIAEGLGTSIALAGEHTKRIVSSGSIRTIGVYDHGLVGRPLTANVHISFARQATKHAATIAHKLPCNLVMLTSHAEQVTTEISVENEAEVNAWIERVRHIGEVRSIRWDPLMAIYKQTYDWAVPGDTPKSGEP